MSRTNKPRSGSWKGFGGHTYRSKHLTWAKKEGNQRVRQEVHQRLKDVLFTDAFDEKEIPGENKGHFFDRWYYD